MFKAFGVQTPTGGEDAVSWATWSNGAGGPVGVVGDANWGKLKLNLTGEEARSAVVDHGSEATRTYTLTENLYGSGSGDAVLQIRGSAASFAQDDLTPLWETYSAPISRSWRYVQIRQSTLIETYILDTFGARIISYLPLKEASGTTLADVSGNGRNGTVGGATGPTLGVEGIGDGKTAVWFPGSNAHINWYSDSLRDAFDGAEGTFLAFAKVSAAGVWSDGTSRRVARLYTDASNFVNISRSSSLNNMVLIQHMAAGTSRFAYAGSNAYIGWMMFGITWSAAAGEVFAWVNGGKFGESLGAPGAWSGALGSTTCALGATNTSSDDGWSGSEAHAVLLNRPATAAEMLNIYRSLTGTKVISIVGDSIARYASTLLKWIDIVRDGYNGGRCAVVNHAVSGNGIIANMDTQVTAAANDNADIVIITLGTNDDNAGNMTTLQAEVEENIIELKASNPNATLYYMNILPRWIDETGVTEVDKSNLRAAIAAACTAQSITCWDTYTDPWIAAADTADGLHPNEAGYALIAAEILAVLP